MKPTLQKLIRDAEKASKRLTGALNRIKGSNLTQPQDVRILNTVARHYHITVEAIKSPVRTQSLCWPRFVAAYLYKSTTKMTLSEIGRVLGGRDHGTALHAIRQVEFEIQSYPQRKRELAEIEAKLAAQN